MLSRSKYSLWILCTLLLIPMLAHATLDTDSRLLISATSRVPVIDGTLDQVWKNTSRMYMRKFVENKLDNHKWRDQFAVFRVMYDDDYVYVHVEIMDEDPYGNDGVELFFDGNNSKNSASTGYDDDDFHLRWLYGNTSEAFGKVPHSVAAWKNTTFGYNLEVKIPKSDLNLILQEGQEIGFDVGAFDNDDGVSKSHVRWWSGNIASETNPSLFGTALFVRRTVSDSLDFTKMNPAPVVDGELDDVWYSVPVIGQNNYVDQYNQTNLATFVDWYDLQMSYRAGWDATGIYLYVNVIDDAISTAHADAWRNDGIEIFIDGNNDKSSTYDSNDINFRWMYGKTKEDGDDAPNSTVVFVDTDSGYVFEAFIPNADLPFTVSENHVFGLDVQVNDNDAVDREGMVRWFGNSANAYQDASLLGTAYLSSQSLDYITVQPDTFEVNYQSGAQTVTLTYYGTSTVGWTSAVIDGESWIRITSETSGSGSGTVQFEYDANTSTSGRSGQIEIRCLGEDAISPKVVNVIQSGVPVYSYNHVLVVHGGNYLGDGDQALVDHMESVGIDVELVKDSDASISDATGKDAIFILESVAANYVNTKFKNATIPVIVNEPYLYEEMEMSASPSVTGNNAYRLAIVAPDERLAFGFSDTISVYTQTTGVFNLGVPGSEATTIATAVGDGRAAIFYYDTGDHLIDGSVAPAPRIGFFINSQYGKSLTESGKRLLEATLDWALPQFDLPKVKIVNPWVNDFTAGDKVLNPGEFVQLSFSVKNDRKEALSRIVGIPDKDFDPYLHPDDAYFFDSRLEVNAIVASGSSISFDALDTYVASVIPSGHTITVPVKFYDQNNLPVGLDTLKFEVVGTDTRVPFFASDTILVTYQPTYLPVDSVATMMTFVHEAGTIASAVASIKDKNESEVVRINLYDDGTHGDTLALDRVFTTQWKADTEGAMDVTFIVEDQHGNVGADTNAVSFIVVPRRASEFNLVAPTGLPDTLIINNATIESDILQVGDQIGVFDDTLCVGAINYTGTFPLSVQIWYQNGSTAPGAVKNHLMLFKIWDKSEDVLYRGFPIFEQGNGVFGESETVVERLNSKLSSAFNLIDPTGRYQTLYIDSTTIVMTTLGVGDQIGVFDDTLCVGAAIFEGMYPVSVTVWLESGNAIGAKEGNPVFYHIWDQSTQALLDGFPKYVVGQGLFGEDSIRVEHLHSGFANGVTPILPTGKYETVTINSATLVSTSIVAGDQIGVFDDTLCVGSAFFDGTYPVIVPVWDTQIIRGTTHLGAASGQAIAYKIWDASSGLSSRAFPVYTYGNGLFGEDTIVVKRLYSQLNESLAQIDPTGLYQTVYIEKAYYQNDTLQVGDQLGLFNNNLCVGAAIYEGTYPLAVPVWLDNEEVGAGAVKNMPISYKIWDKTNVRLLSGFPVYSAGKGLFGEDSTYVKRLQSDMAEPLLQVDPTGSFKTIKIEDATIERNPLVLGDQVAVFDDTLCVGAAMYEGSYPLLVTIWYENTIGDTTYAGAHLGNTMSYEVWDSQYSQELIASALYTLGDGVFGEDTTVVSKLITDAIALKLKIKPNVVNMVSYNLLPDSLEIEALFRPLTTLTMIQNDAGEYYFPAQSVNTLGDVEFTKGYEVFADLDTIQPLSYIGSALDPTEYSLALTAGETYMLGYPYRNGYTVENVYGTMRSKVRVMQNDEGEFWIPTYGINTMINLIPGEGYQVVMNNDVDFTYPDLSAKAIATAKDTVVTPTHFEFEKTGLPYAIVISGVVEEMAPGDEIAVFDGELCVGAVVVPEAYPVVMAAWEGNDAFKLTGFRESNDISFKIWRSADSTKHGITALFDTEAEAKFKGAAMTVVRLQKIDDSGIDNSILPTVFALEQNYPNPFNPETTIRYQLPQKADVSLVVYNMLGQEIKQLVRETAPAGFYTAQWDGTNQRGLTVESGLYFVRMKAGDYVKTHKMIMVK